MRGRRSAPNYFLVGVIAIVVVVGLSALAFTKSLPFVSGYQIEGVFSTSNQLRNGSPVRIAGVDVGKVTGAEAGPGNTTIVKMDIKDSGRPVHQDAELRIRPRLFLEGGFYVELSPGTAGAPEVDDGGTIPLPQTQGTVQLHQILSTLDTPTRDSLRTVIREASTALDRGGAESVGRASRHLAPAFRDLAIVAEAARGTQPHDLSEVIRSTSRVTRALASRETQLADLVTNLARTTDALASQDTALAASVRELDGVLREAPPALSALDRALPPVERFAAALRPSLRIAPPVLTGASELVGEVDGLVGPRELPALIAVAKPLMRDLPSFVRNLDGLFRRVRPVTDCIGERVNPVLTATLDDGHLSTGRPVWQDLAHGVVGLASTSQSFDGNGVATRYLAGAGSEGVATGSVPGVGSLFGQTERPILGSRPRWLGPGVTPPYRPDLNCADQPAPDLTARSSPAGGGG